MGIIKYNHPVLFEKLLNHILPFKEEEGLIGDFKEIFAEIVSKRGIISARLWYSIQILKFTPSYLTDSVYWSFVMITNYIKLSFRNMRKNKGFSFINIFGLTLGITCCILMMLWIQDELSFDKFHEETDNIYRIVQEADHAGFTTMLARTPEPLAAALTKDYPEIIESSIFEYAELTFVIDNKRFPTDGCWVNPGFFNIFSFDVVNGSRESILNDKLSIALSESAANRFFGSEDPVGRTLQLGGDLTFTVTAVFRDIPVNSHIQFDFAGSFELMYEYGFRKDMWFNSNNPIYTYVLLENGVVPEDVNDKIAGLTTENSPETITRLFLQPLKEIHLYSNFNGDLQGHGNITYVIILSITAIFILLIACINFINLATARSGKRAKEVGMRKVVGAHKSDIVKQFFSETTMMSLFAYILAIGLSFLLLPTFNSLSGKQLSLVSSLNFPILTGLVCIAVFTGIVSGSYPAVFLSSFQPAKVLKGGIYSGSGKSLFRKTLVLVQFSLTIILLISTFIVFNQLSFMQTKNLGFNRESLVYFHLNGELGENFDTFKQEVKQNPGILNVTYGSHELTDVTHVHGNLQWEGKDPNIEISMNCILVESDFVKTLGMEIIDGRDFSKEFSTDEHAGFIVNEEAVRQMGFESPVGKKITYGRSEGAIIGIIRDFHFKPLRKEIEPMVLINSPNEKFFSFLRIAPGDISNSIETIEKAYHKFMPDSAFEYFFLDESLDRLYRAEQRTGKIINYFTVLAILISCLGLTGLSSFLAEQRTKEIGIRKVLGASTPGIVFTLIREFFIIVITANLIAWPIAYYFMDKWLLGFAYRTGIGIQIFILSAVIALVIAVITVSYHSLKAAVSNPIKSLRYE